MDTPQDNIEMESQTHSTRPQWTQARTDQMNVTAAVANNSTNKRILNSVQMSDERDEDQAQSGGVDDGLMESGTQRWPPAQQQHRRPSYAFPGYNGPGFVEINGVQTQIPDVNAYQNKKTLAQGMMDLALLSANANQLRYVLETYRHHPYFYPSVTFISLSIAFQVLVGVGLLLNTRYDIKDAKEICRANKINNYTVIGIFVVTVVNVFVSAFGVAEPVGGNT